MKRIAESEAARDAVVTRETAEGEAERMGRTLARLKAIGRELATLPVWEAYIRSFPNRKLLVALWRFRQHGVLPDGAEMKAAWKHGRLSFGRADASLRDPRLADCRRLSGTDHTALPRHKGFFAI